VVVHPIVCNVVGAYLDLVDAEAPGLVEGLYLVGSVALEDFRPKASDIDFIVVTAKPLTEADLAALERTHSQLATRLRRPFFDGAYVTWHDLTGDPALAGRCRSRASAEPRRRGVGRPAQTRGTAMQEAAPAGHGSAPFSALRCSPTYAVALPTPASTAISTPRAMQTSCGWRGAVAGGYRPGRNWKLLS
jgi:hypothetical protein